MNKSVLLELLESVQNMLTDRATGGSPNEADYNELRQILISEDQISGELPRFVRTCRSLSQFWAYISKESGTYAGRREHIWKEFAPLLEQLEINNSSALDFQVSETLEKFDPHNVHSLWMRALERRVNDPEGAITLSRTLLESVCKYIIED